MPTLKVVLSFLWKTLCLAILAGAFVYAIYRIKFFWSISSVSQLDFYFYYYSFEIMHQHKDPSLYIIVNIFLIGWSSMAIPN